MSTEHQSADLKAEDADSYKQKRRLRMILDARERVRDVFREVDTALLDGGFTEDVGNAAIRMEVVAYIHELEDLIKNSNHQETYWEEKPLGELELEHSENIQFRGLASIVNSPPRFVEQWVETTEHRHRGNEQELRKRKHQIPRSVLERAYRACNEFCHESSLNLDLDEGRQSFGFETELEDDE